MIRLRKHTPFEWLLFVVIVCLTGVMLHVFGGGR